MSKYTTELRFICESLIGLDESVGNKKTEEVINKARPLIFNFSFPIFESGYAVGLENKIIDHFYFREIGYETFGLWQNRLHMKLNEIMPYYNKLYKSEELEYDPLGNLDYTVIHDGEYEDFNRLDKTGTNTTEKAGTDTDTHSGTDARTFGADEYHGDSWTLFSDTPQGGLDGIQNATDDVKSNAYLTNATRNILDYNDSNTDNMEYGHTIDHDYDSSITNTRNTADVNNGHGTKNWVEQFKGRKDIDPNKMLKEYRDNLLNIDMMIINELEDLFMKLW